MCVLWFLFGFLHNKKNEQWISSLLILLHVKEQKKGASLLIPHLPLGTWGAGAQGGGLMWQKNGDFFFFKMLCRFQQCKIATTEKWQSSDNMSIKWSLLTLKKGSSKLPSRQLEFWLHHHQGVKFHSTDTNTDTKAYTNTKILGTSSGVLPLQHRADVKYCTVGNAY